MNPVSSAAPAHAPNVRPPQSVVTQTLLDLPDDVLHDVVDHLVDINDQHALRLSHRRLCCVFDAHDSKRTQAVAHLALRALAQGSGLKPRLGHLALHAGGIDLKPQVLDAPRLSPLPRQILLLEATSHLRSASLTLSATDVVPRRGDWATQNAIDQQLETMGRALGEQKKLESLTCTGDGWALPFVQRILRPHLAAQAALQHFCIDRSAARIWPLIPAMANLSSLEILGPCAFGHGPEAAPWLESSCFAGLSALPTLKTLRINLMGTPYASIEALRHHAASYTSLKRLDVRWATHAGATSDIRLGFGDKKQLRLHDIAMRLSGLPEPGSLIRIKQLLESSSELQQVSCALRGPGQNEAYDAMLKSITLCPDLTALKIRRDQASTDAQISALTCLVQKARKLSRLEYDEPPVAAALRCDVGPLLLACMGAPNLRMLSFRANHNDFPWLRGRLKSYARAPLTHLDCLINGTSRKNDKLLAAHIAQFTQLRALQLHESLLCDFPRKAVLPHLREFGVLAPRSPFGVASFVNRHHTLQRLKLSQDACNFFLEQLDVTVPEVRLVMPDFTRLPEQYQFSRTEILRLAIASSHEQNEFDEVLRAYALHEAARFPLAREMRLSGTILRDGGRYTYAGVVRRPSPAQKFGAVHSQVADPNAGRPEGSRALVGGDQDFIWASEQS